VKRTGLAVAVVALSGCGSSGLSDKDYRSKAGAICAQVRAQRDRLPPASNLEELRAAAQSTIAINTDALRKFKELDPPDDLKGPHDAIVSRLGETLRLQQQALKASPSSATMQSLNSRAAQVRAALLAAAQRAKLPACERL
jgi:hypothetical protein